MFSVGHSVSPERLASPVSAPTSVGQPPSLARPEQHLDARPARGEATGMRAACELAKNEGARRRRLPGIEAVRGPEARPPRR